MLARIFYGSRPPTHGSMKVCGVAGSCKRFDRPTDAHDKPPHPAHSLEERQNMMVPWLPLAAVLVKRNRWIHPRIDRLSGHDRASGRPGIEQVQPAGVRNESPQIRQRAPKYATQF